ncbi:hypothetical protein [Kribbella sp. CA-293567]|uniref:hypothetical protein n=1 Tax=Kribbella sp. CA-293567 TaxID=3002436 RepID=UPI0022DDC6E9|nr:hypothetical protein [Kribbella sp. CA-293567]WBQ02982.1 hypothetical protein OX958_23730 [Kribbella sp. CA-293567]
MTTEAVELTAVQHGTDSIPMPAMDRLPKGSAVRRLAEILGRPNLAVRVTELLGQHVSVVLAQAVDAAFVRRITEIEAEVEARLTAEYAVRFAAELEQAHAAIVDRWSIQDHADHRAEVSAQQEIEDAVRRGAESDTAVAVVPEQPEIDCVSPEPQPWATRVDLRQPPLVLAGVFNRASDDVAEQAEQARIDRFMAGGNDA